MPRGLDHIVHAVNDLDAAAAFYRRCGFQVGKRNRHPWGTHNRIVQLPGFFVEILTVAEPEKIVPHAARSFSFGAFQQEYLGHKQGFNMLLMRSDDACADAESFKTAGIGDFEVFDFAREGSKPDGTSVKLAFSLAFARDPHAPGIGFAVCQHHFPENFWNPDFQQHENGALGVAGVVLVADRPDEHAVFLRALTGIDDSEPRIDDVMLRTPGGEIEVITSVIFSDRYGAVPQVGDGAVLSALRIAVESLDAIEAILRDGDIPLHRHGALLAVPPQAAFGATLVFEQAEIA